MEPVSPRRVSANPPEPNPSGSYKQYRHSLSNAQCSTVTRYLLLGWKCNAIATECGISSRSVYRIQENLMRYGSVRKPHYRTLGRAKKLSKADEEALFEYLLHEGWRQQDEIKYWLWHEREVDINQSTISRLFKRRKWSRKHLKRISLNRSEVLRRGYLDDIRQFAAEDLIFLDESIFNEKTGWRYHAYAPTGTAPEIHSDINRGKI